MPIYLGLDSSTQSLKAELIDTDHGILAASATVNFGRDLPEYRCPEGYLQHSDPLVRHSDPLLWAAALDLVLQRLQQSGAPLDRVAGIGGSGQQHGSVYLNDQWQQILSVLNPASALAPQIAPALARKTAPIWMDRATARQCAELNARFGTRLQQDTGSPAVERFTGPQIRKFAQDDPAGYRKTATIHLVSSFMASLLCGADAPIDYGDGAGMNLLKLKTLAWDREIVEFTASGLLHKLPCLAPATAVAGKLHPYFAKYGLKAGTPVAVWSGDNPCSLIGTGAWQAGTAVISLGTSDTFFAAMRQPVTDPQGYGHVFGNPAGGFMCLICFTNGSLAREQVKNDCGVDWQYFNSGFVPEAPAGNRGNLMLPWFTAESVPLVLQPGAHYRGEQSFIGGTAPAAVKVRAILEGQALAMRLHSGWIGEPFSRIRVTGGASQCTAFVQILADVFQTPVERLASTGAAGIGAAMLAAHAVGGVSFEQLTAQFAAPVEIIRPQPQHAAVYDSMLEAYRRFEAETRSRQG